MVVAVTNNSSWLIERVAETFQPFRFPINEVPEDHWVFGWLENLAQSDHAPVWEPTEVIGATDVNLA